MKLHLFAIWTDFEPCARDTVDYDWNFQTAAQVGAANRVIHYARGKGIGGSSQRNFSTFYGLRPFECKELNPLSLVLERLVIYQRPTSDSFEFWLNATNSTNSPGWSWDDVYPVSTGTVTLFCAFDT